MKPDHIVGTHCTGCAAISQHGPAERLRLHREAAARIEQRFAADLAPHLQQLAWHSYEAARGGYLPAAVGHCRRAAGQALERRAYGEAALQFERALQVATWPRTPTRRCASSC